MRKIYLIYSFLLLSQTFFSKDLNFFSSLRRIKYPLGKFERLKAQIPGAKVKEKIEAWKYKWVETQPVIPPGKKLNYIILLENVRAVVNPNKANFIVYYPGIGPAKQKEPSKDIRTYLPDLSSAHLASNYTVLVAVDKEKISFEEFKQLAKQDLMSLEGVILRDEWFQKIDEYTYQVSYFFENKLRYAKIYYNRDANTFFPEELKNGYDMLYTRWCDGLFNPSKEIVELWLGNLNPQAGFLLIDGIPELFFRFPSETAREMNNYFWSRFDEFPLSEYIETDVIGPEEGHLSHFYTLKIR